MANCNITLVVDSQTADAYQSAPAEDKQKIQALLSLWLRDLASSTSPSLQQVLDDVGAKAQAQGLTPEILESLLKGA